MGFDVQDGIFCKSFPFKHCGIEKSDLEDRSPAANVSPSLQQQSCLQYLLLELMLRRQTLFGSTLQDF